MEKVIKDSSILSWLYQVLVESYKCLFFSWLLYASINSLFFAIIFLWDNSILFHNNTIFLFLSNSYSRDWIWYFIFSKVLKLEESYTNKALNEFL